MSRKQILIVLGRLCISTLLLIIGVFPATVDGAENLFGGKRFHVALEGNDDWSGTQSTPNPDKKDGPFATLQRAREAVREFRRNQPDTVEPVYVHIQGGTHYLSESLELTAEDSGTEKSPTVYVGDVEIPSILSAGRRITDWKETVPGRWTRTIPQVASGEWYFEQLYVGGARRFRCAVPKKGYFFIDRPVNLGEGTRPDRFLFHKGDLSETWSRPEEIEILTFHRWTMDHHPVRSIDAETRLLVMKAGTHNWRLAPLEKGTPYRVANVHEALSEPGEWYLDRQSGVLTYLSFPGEDPNQLEVVAPRFPRVVSVLGDYENGNDVRHVHFRDLVFAHSAWTLPPTGAGCFQAAVYLDGALTFRGARHCQVRRCAVLHTGNYAVDFGDACHDCVLAESELYDLGGGGVKIGPTRFHREPNEKKWGSRCKVLRNRITHGGRLHPDSVGIWVGHASHNEIVGNEVRDFYYSGISVGWNWNHNFSPAHDNIVRHNHIHDIGQGVIDDMAGIYTLGVSPGTVISHNVIHDVSRKDYGGWGIYLDASSEGILVEHNLTYDTEDAGICLSYDVPNTIRRNIFAKGRNGQFRLSIGGKNGRPLFEENLFYYSGDHLFEPGHLAGRAEMKGNVYWNTSETVLFPGELSFEQWKAVEPDAVLEDPGFKNPGNRDFTGHRFIERIGPSSDMLSLMQKQNCGIGNENIGQRRFMEKLPPVLVAFGPAPKAIDLLRDATFEETFEEFPTGQGIPAFSVHSTSDSFCRITDATAAAGRHSVEFREGTDKRDPWVPQLFLWTKYRNDKIRMSFDLRVEEGAVCTMESRELNGFQEQYKVGPCFTVHEDGKLFAGGVDLNETAPWGKWFHVDMTVDLSPGNDGSGTGGTFTLLLTLPDREPKRYEALPCFGILDRIDWVGLFSLGKDGTRFYLDNFKLGIL